LRAPSCARTSLVALADLPRQTPRRRAPWALGDDARLVDGLGGVLVFHPFGERTEGFSPVRFGEIPGSDHLAATALDHHSPPANRAEEIVIVGPHGSRGRRRCRLDESGLFAQEGQMPPDGVVEAAALTPCEKRCVEPGAGLRRIAPLGSRVID